MLHEVAAGDLDFSDIVSPPRQVLKHVVCLEAEVERIDLDERRVTLAYGVFRRQKELFYDHLVIALGSETNFFKLPGVEERALTMKSLGDAFYLRNHALALLEIASLTEDGVARRAMLTFVVAGGGFAGTETIGALIDYLRSAKKYYPALAKDNVRVVLVHPGAVILPELGESLGRYAQGKLAARNVEIRLETRVAGYTDRGVELKNGEIIPALTLVWTAGVTPPAILQSLPCKKEKGRVVVEETLEVPGFPGVWALGDCAWIPNPQTGNPHPPTAQHALREAFAMREEHRCGDSRRTEEGFRVHHPRSTRIHWPSHGSRQNNGFSLLRSIRVVVVAGDLPRQTAALREEGSRGIEVDLGNPVLKRHRTICDFGRPRSAGRRIEYLRHHPLISAQAAQTRPPEQSLDSEPRSGVG